jgi:hypothetical protein
MLFLAKFFLHVYFGNKMPYPQLIVKAFSLPIASFCCSKGDENQIILISVLPTS